MKNLIILSVALLSVWHTATGQITGKISLKVVNAKQQVAPNSFVELLSAKDSTVVEFGMTDKNGIVQFDNLKYGKYKVFLPQNGLNSYLSNTISINNPDEEYSFTITCKTPNSVGIKAYPAWYIDFGSGSTVS